MTKLYNQTSERYKRQTLRNNMPPSEKIVWAKLRNQQIESCKFRRQYSIDRFVVDFYSSELRLAIETDGDSHYQDGVPEYDRDRQAFLESKGTRFLRFTNQEVYQNIDGVVDKIREVICRLREVTPPVYLSRPHRSLIKEREAGGSSFFI
ncbi:MAG: endonuclease domain-containing protein [Nostoc sp. DedVER02]|uniref:endonuclease domain-containing protein n=1 Tax=unclassified Nostoc TaxID=2593658 RepID=UPI002AD41D00|nr:MULTISPECIES: endonuclease domain-containing protein [unclassified Nostoc]MDZ7986699.1 endonuclease domain-containing protein [Nostoc sp. DedVER02]MDZ8112348.1 endonuclease domain-containing protein [Nostoc sp. DedVER01b]